MYVSRAQKCSVACSTVLQYWHVDSNQSPKQRRRLPREKVRGEEGLGQNLKERHHSRLGREKLAKEM